MRKLILIAVVALSACLGLNACNKHSDDQQAQDQVQKATKPTDINDSKAWNNYLGQLVQANLQGMKAPQPYAYLVTPGTTGDQQAQNARQLQGVQDTVARGVLPGNLLAFGGPSSAATSEFVIDAFKHANPGAFKDVIVVFIGDKADESKVEDALKPTGATFRFVEM
ncbi:MAG: hypothetical protein ABI389_08655 [Rhodanobacter sp.]